MEELKILAREWLDSEESNRFQDEYELDTKLEVVACIMLCKTLEELGKYYQPCDYEWLFSS